MTEGEQRPTEEETLEVPEVLSTSPVQILGEQRETLDVPEVLTTLPVEEIQRRREIARGWIAGILGVTFLATTIWVLFTATFFGEAAWANTLNALQILLPVESSLLGSAVVFYFTGPQNR